MKRVLFFAYLAHPGRLGTLGAFEINIYIYINLKVRNVWTHEKK